MKTDFKKLQIENNKLRKDINKILQKEFSAKEKDYKDIWDNINNLINNEILQEGECGE